VVECLPGDLPEFIELDLSNLAVGDVIHLSQLKLPKGVELPELKLGAEHDVAVVTAKYVKVEDESAEGEASADVPAAKVADDSEAKDAE